MNATLMAGFAVFWLLTILTGGFAMRAGAALDGRCVEKP